MVCFLAKTISKNEIKDRAKLVKEWFNDEDWTEARNIWQKINR